MPAGKAEDNKLLVLDANARVVPALQIPMAVMAEFSFEECWHPYMRLHADFPCEPRISMAAFRML